MEQYNLLPGAGRDGFKGKRGQKLSVKVGAPVVLLKNMKKLGLFNGSRGTVIGFTPTKMPIVRFANGETVPFTSTSVLDLSWALTMCVSHRF